MLGPWIYAQPQENRPGAAGLLATGTGATLLNLSGWALVPGPDAAPYVVRTAPDAPGTPTDPGWLGLLRPAAGPPVIRPLGPVPGISGTGCGAASRYVVCETTEHRLQIWRFRA
jgi:hypothetical protein